MKATEKDYHNQGSGRVGGIRHSMLSMDDIKPVILCAPLAGSILWLPVNLQR